MKPERPGRSPPPKNRNSHINSINHPRSFISGIGIAHNAAHIAQIRTTSIAFIVSYPPTL